MNLVQVIRLREQRSQMHVRTKNFLIFIFNQNTQTTMKTQSFLTNELSSNLTNG